MTSEEKQKKNFSEEREEEKQGYLLRIKENDQDAQAWHALALIFAEEHDDEAAYEALKKAMDLSPNNVVIQLHYANILKARGAFDEAIQQLLMLTQSHPDCAPAFNNLGIVFFAQKKYSLAIQAYEQALAIEPAYIDAYYNLGLALQQNAQSEAAAKVYQALLELVPDHAAGLFQFASLLMRQAAYEDALKHYINLEKNYPYHFETQSNLATCYMRIGRWREAISHYLNALAIEPTDSQVLYNLGVLYLKRHDFAQAIHYFVQAKTSGQDDFALHNNLGVAYLGLKQKENAVFHFQHALSFDPENQAIQHSIALLTQQNQVNASPLEYVRALFNSYADHYDQHVQSQLAYQVPQQMRQLLQSISATLASWQIVDLGCGTGLVAEMLRAQPMDFRIQKLVGVDIAENMLEQAAQKKHYDELICDDILRFLSNYENEQDLIIAADVLMYFGELHTVFNLTSRILRQNRYFLFSIELSQEKENYTLQSSGRFQHCASYVQSELKKNKFEIIKCESAQLRVEAGRSVLGQVYLVRKN